jgi:hypothetical protein
MPSLERVVPDGDAGVGAGDAGVGDDGVGAGVTGAAGAGAGAGAAGASLSPTSSAEGGSGVVAHDVAVDTAADVTKSTVVIVARRPNTSRGRLILHPQ